MNNKIKTIVLVSLIIIQMMLIWSIDISIYTHWAGNHLTNGFMVFEPLQIYHISLYLLIITIAIVACIVFFEIQHSSAFVEKKQM